jgi:hypothetical protein
MGLLPAVSVNTTLTTIAAEQLISGEFTCRENLGATFE